ncbi:Uncharacterized membrane protein [Arsukibacterium tuosuense]|uniref:Uncharacterized membrane protein n=1 Tax=Arsukibacterium tuosuense TaxID=1323745 RepID=A0A285IUT7_9GAMM|nr:DUF2061 domain-containing protein [Arsukibacterium tuosuense]SNY50701.1 Uncharacterized membrane protein [Arsukibacterium tuosuense]
MIKTITFALMHFTIAFGVTYAITGDLVLGGLVAVIEPAANTVAYFFHEKIWQRLQQDRPVRHSVPKRSRTLVQL